MEPAKTFDELKKQLEDCAACLLRKDCQAPVGWFGNLESPLMIVGEGPGGVEDDYGCPLIGPSGQLLDKALWSVRITRDRIYTTNVIKCRPRGNRTPTVEEGSFCARLWLEQEIRLLRPKVILALGSVALRYFKGPEARITRERGQWFTTGEGIPCLATFHPSYLLRLTGQAQIAAKWDVFHDLEAVKAKVEEQCPGYSWNSGAPVHLFALFRKRS